MNQSAVSLLRSRAVLGAGFMVLAGIAFAALNVVTQELAMTLGFPPASTAFWQYGFALILSLPLLVRLGLRAMKTGYPFRHIFRVLLAAFGVQAWVMGLVTVPIWQAIALVMTSPFFIIIGARLFLGETVGRDRWLATLTGFIGAMIILQPWSDSFTMAALLPILSALLWGGSSLIMKNLTHHEPPETVTVWLLVLLTPINAGLAAASGFAVPEGLALWLLLGAGLLTALGQYLLTLAYNAADAAYVQPFDDLKLPLNVFAGWIVFGYAPSGYLWLGALLILCASLFLMLREAGREATAAS
ncbi:DMT family transporter [Agrobacterium larrymoorei]|uniref:Drug/metabolite transporter (DMT)-like permease n=1 Tax=Agrobacterium larrymoorei TaxID=160699 RepID=A0ABU0ULJ3_9HYPH|nr:DMT family transporter [Agrobacterium larrymoorei]MDQ1185751.1 drug/metabolite transporter (DMT)-like permease [Agrobacterium larrymoorei]